MKIGRIHHGGAPATVVIEGDVARVLTDVSVLDALADPSLGAGGGEELALGEVQLLAPLSPPTIRDYSVFEQHVEGAVMAGGGPEAKMPPAWYEKPAFYFSNPNVVSGPGDAIAAPPGSTMLDLEFEIAAIVGRRGSNVAPEDAAAHIAGYTIFNDWSARDIGALEGRLPFGFHKTKDFANTLGPWIITPDELDPFRDGDRLDLDLRTFVNGSEIGSDTLANMAWSFEELVSFSSIGSVIAPGDVIASGTCGGGCLFELWGRTQSFDDPAPLQAGDEVRLEAEGIGTLTNTIVAQEMQAPHLPPARPGRLRQRAGTAT